MKTKMNLHFVRSIRMLVCLECILLLLAYCSTGQLLHSSVFENRLSHCRMYRGNKDLEGDIRVLLQSTSQPEFKPCLCSIYLTTFSAAESKFSVRVKSKGVTEKNTKYVLLPPFPKQETEGLPTGPQFFLMPDVVTVNRHAFYCSVSSSLMHLSTEIWFAVNGET